MKLRSIATGPCLYDLSATGVPPLLTLVQDTLERSFHANRAVASLHAIVAPADAAERCFGQGARAVIYDAATHPTLADCIDVAAMDVWALQGAVERVVRTWPQAVGADARARRVRHACQMAGGFAAAWPRWWHPDTPRPPELQALLDQASLWLRGTQLMPRAFASAWLAALVVKLPDAATRCAALTHLEARGAFHDALAPLLGIEQKLAQLHAWFVDTLPRGVALTQPHRGDLLQLADALSADKTPCLPVARYHGLRASVAYALGTLGVAGTGAWLSFHADMPIIGLRAGWAQLGGDAARAQAAIWQRDPAQASQPGHATWLVDIDMPDIAAHLEALWEAPSLRRGGQSELRAEIFAQVLRLRQPMLVHDYVNSVLQTWDVWLHAHAARSAAQAGWHAEAQRLATVARSYEAQAQAPITQQQQLDIIEHLQQAMLASPAIADTVGALFVQFLQQAPSTRLRARLNEALQYIDTPTVNQYLLTTSAGRAAPARNWARELLLRTPRGIDCEPWVRSLLKLGVSPSCSLPALPWLLRQGEVAAARKLVLPMLTGDDRCQALALKEVSRSFAQQHVNAAIVRLAIELTAQVLLCLESEPLSTPPRVQRVIAAVQAVRVLHAYNTADARRRMVLQLADVARDSAFYASDAVPAAIAALGELDTPEALAALLDIGEQAAVSERVFQAIANMVHCADAAAEHMARWATHDEAAMRAAAVATLARLRPRAYAGIFWHALTDRAWSVRTAAVLGLSTLNDPEAHAAVLRALSEDPLMARQAETWSAWPHIHPEMQRALALRFNLPTGWTEARDAGYLLKDAAAVASALARVSLTPRCSVAG